MTHLFEITRFLDETLQIRSMDDVSHNGLQVQNRSDIQKIAFAVDACLESFQLASEKGAQLLITHHGISWGDGLSYVTSINYNRIKFLMEHDLALYVAHLPLDAHADYGNNVGIFRKLGMQRPRQFGYIGSTPIGLIGSVEKQSVESFAQFVEEKLGVKVTVWDFGKKEVERIAVVSGRGASFIGEAIAAGADVLLTGEVVHDSYHSAKDGQLTVIAAGHYATETIGLELLSKVVKEKFNIETIFVSSDTGL